MARARREPAPEAAQKGGKSRRCPLIEPEDARGPPTTLMHAHIRGVTCVVSLRPVRLEGRRERGQMFENKSTYVCDNG